MKNSQCQPVVINFESFVCLMENSQELYRRIWLTQPGVTCSERKKSTIS